jgi:hypothetical protein
MEVFVSGGGDTGTGGTGGTTTPPQLVGSIYRILKVDYAINNFTSEQCESTNE